MSVMAKRAASTAAKTRSGSTIIGRSPATGLYVLEPKNSKAATVSDSAIQAAIKSIRSKQV